MTLQETKNKINEVQSTTKDYQDAINGVQTKLMSLIDDVNSVKSSIASDIKEESIVSHSKAKGKEINSKIKKTLGKSRTALDTLSVDATKYIRKIVDEYNGSLEEDSEAERLSYVEIKLSSVSGCPSEGDSDSNGDYSGDWGGGNDDSGTTLNIDYYLDLLKYDNVYSRDIENWETYVNNFLVANNLQKVIETIIIEGKKIKVRLKNGKEYIFENITSTIDLLKALYEAIEKDAGNNE